MSNKIFSKISTSLLFVVLLLIQNTFLFSQEDTSLKLITPQDYGKWEKLIGPRISDDGTWIKYQINTQEGDQNTYLFNTVTRKESVFKNASISFFSENAKWFAFTNVPTGKESKELEKKKDKNTSPKISKIINLETNDTIELSDVNSFIFNKKETFLAMKRQKEKVNTLIVRNLSTGMDVTFGNVKEFAWQPNGDNIAMLIDVDDKVGNAIQLYNPITETIKVLEQKNEVYSQLSWLKDSDHLFALRKLEDSSYNNETYTLLLWKDLNSKKTTFKQFDQNKFSNFPKDTRILDNRISFSKDGTKVFFSTYSWQIKSDKKNESSDKESNSKNSEETESPDVEIWNSRDEVMISVQKRSQMKDLEQPQSVVWLVDEDKFVPLSDALTENVQVAPDNQTFIGLDQTPYEFEAMFGRPRVDVYTIQLHTGDKTKILSNVFQNYPISPNNQYFVYLDANHLHLFDIKKGISTNITEKLDGKFIDEEDDHPIPQKSAFGFGKWSTDSKSFLIYEEYDVWQIFTDGSPSKKITNGKKDQIRYRYLHLDTEINEIDMSKPVYFRMEGMWSKKTGYAYGKIGGDLKTLIYDDFSILINTKAKNSDKLIYSKQSNEFSPNLFVSNAVFENPIQISNTNSFQKEYYWSKATLIEYKNALGKTAQGILYYPADYQKGKQYPMITYIYEKLSNGFHRYQEPSSTNYYSSAVWTQNGYFVLNPDIDFIPGDPGISSARTLENAVSAVVKLGDVNPEKVGLVGHSWGGYQAGYVPTQTNVFAASVAGAGLTEFISMNLAVTPAFGGLPENNHFEVGQERMISAPWISPENYLRNSSVMQIEKLNTPILFEVGDNDENVNWSQGIAYYNAARRANKHFVLLVYAKEGHGLRNKKNQEDYQQRILKWFGHYLKDEQAEDWVLKGIPYAEQMRRLKK